jgi:hypothetical protein
MCKNLVDLLKKYNLDSPEGCQKENLPIVIQSFNIPLLKYVEGCSNYVVQLYDKHIEIT